jgi:hypothetical protein
VRARYGRRRNEVVSRFGFQEINNQILELIRGGLGIGEDRGDMKDLLVPRLALFQVLRKERDGA